MFKIWLVIMGIGIYIMYRFLVFIFWWVLDGFLIFLVVEIVIVVIVIVVVVIIRI